MTFDTERPPGHSQDSCGCTEPPPALPAYTFTSAATAKIAKVRISIDRRAYWIRAEISMPR